MFPLFRRFKEWWEKGVEEHREEVRKEIAEIDKKIVNFKLANVNLRKLREQNIDYGEAIQHNLRRIENLEMKKEELQNNIS